MILKPCPFCGKDIPRSIQACPYCHRDEQGAPVRMDTAAVEDPDAQRYYEQDLEDLGSADAFRRDQAVVRMGRRGYGVVQALISILSDPSKPGLAGVAKTLGKIGDARAIQALTQTARTGDEDLRAASLWALAQFRDPAVIEPLSKEAERNHTPTQSYLAYALGERQDVRAVSSLARLAHHADREVAWQAVWALGEIHDPAAAAALARVRRSRDPLIREVASLSLRRLGVRPPSALRWMLAAAAAFAAMGVGGFLWMR